MYIAHDHQDGYTKTSLPYSNTTVPLNVFVEELETGLGRDIDEYFDPQYIPESSRPNYYMYMVNGDNYFFAVHVSQDFSFARNISENYNKIEITNNPSLENKAISFKELIADKDFQNELSKPIIREGVFIERENKYLHYSKNN